MTRVVWVAHVQLSQSRMYASGDAWLESCKLVRGTHVTSSVVAVPQHFRLSVLAVCAQINDQPLDLGWQSHYDAIPTEDWVICLRSPHPH